MDIDEANKLIAEFMEWSKSPYPNLPNKMYRMENDDEIGFPIEYFKYNSSWDWLMPVVEKIGEMVYSVDISCSGCLITRYREGNSLPSHGHRKDNTDSNTLIEAVWNTVVQFIQWHNDQKK